VCEGIAQGFGMSIEDGDRAFTYFRNEGHPENSRGFFELPYTYYESDIKGILAAFLPSANDTQLDILALAAHAMIFSYSVNEAILFDDFVVLLGFVLLGVSSIALENQFFKVAGKSPNAYVVNPFTKDVLTSLLKNDYGDTLGLISSSSKELNVILANYNWYDTTPLFTGPNLSLMKDVENQYYYLSGKLIYESAYGSLEPCIEDTVTINAATGSVTYNHIRNVPCRDASSYVGPVNYVNFNRIFNDGPASSGRFDEDTKKFYVDNDKAELVSGDYLSNAYSLFTYTGSGLIAPSVMTDVNGQYNIPSQEYNNIPSTFNCSTPLHRMHVGDNRPRYVCDTPKDCKCVEMNLTGFKYAALSLPSEDWTSELQFRQTNPLSEFDRILKRSWCIDDHHYIATDEGGVLMPYFQDIVAPFAKHWYVGYPLLRGDGILPELAFFQTFQNSTFGEVASVCIYPAVGSSNGSSTSFSESDRDFDVDDTICLFSGDGSLPIQFNVGISSNLSKHSEMTRKFFGMGTALGGKYNVKVTAEENAGFFYSGFSVTEDGVIINSQTLADNYSNSILGKYKTIKYISGY
jgi:hypothetical protein